MPHAGPGARQQPASGPRTLGTVVMRTPMPRMSRRGRVTLLVLGAVVLLFVFLGWLVDAWTDYLWFAEVRYTSVFTTVLWTRIGLFLVFGAVIAALLWVNLWLAYRVRPLLR